MRLETQTDFPTFVTEAKQKVKTKGDEKFDKIYGNRDSTEDFIRAITKLSAGQAIPANIQTIWTTVQALRTAQTTALQGINAATTRQEVRLAVKTFTDYIKTI